MSTVSSVRRAAILLLGILALGVQSAGATISTFPIPYQQSAVLFPTDDSTLQAFGTAIDAEGDSAVIGAPGVIGDNGFPDGAVFIFQRSPAGWAQVAQLGPLSGLQWTWFGQTVALDGDTLAVGAPGTDVGAYGEPGYVENAGAVYVFTGGGATWQQQGAALMPAELTADSQFGTALDLDGDTLIATVSDHGGFKQEVYIFDRSGETWTQQARISNPDSDNTTFGAEVAVAGDVALVGAPSYFGSNAPGVVYVYMRDGGDWSAAGAFVANDGTPGDNFGCALDFDGVTAIIAACSLAELENPDHAYVFTYQDGEWTQAARLDPAYGDATFNINSLAFDGDRIVLGALEEFYQDTSFIGTSFLFESNGQTWEQTQVLRPDNVERADGFVSDVALAGSDVLTSARWKSRLNVAQTGAVYVFSPRQTGDGLLFLPSIARQSLEQNTGLIVYSDLASLFLVTAYGVGRTEIFDSADSVFDPTWSPDGYRIAFTQYDQGKWQLLISNVHGEVETTIPMNGYQNVDNLAWSPDGESIAFKALAGAYYDLFVINVDGGQPMNLTQTGNDDEFGPVWSPDGEHIAFGDGYRLATMKPDGSDIRPIDGSPAEAKPTDWSPDGSMLLYYQLVDGPPDLYTIPAAGGEPRLVIESGRDGRWSPDGSQIVFSGAGGGLFRVNADGSDLRVVVSSKFAQMPDWQP